MARKDHYRSHENPQRGRPLTITDGPFAETKELIAGRWLGREERVESDVSDLELVTTGEFDCPGDLP